jgi:hypothetical protein
MTTRWVSSIIAQPGLGNESEARQKSPLDYPLYASPSVTHIRDSRYPDKVVLRKRG